MARKYGKKASEKIGKTMHEFKRGKLKSGGSGKKVTSRKQAIAIGIAQARRAGYKVPSPPSPPRGHAAMGLDARVRAHLSNMRSGAEIDARGIARALGGGIDPLEADYALERAEKAGFAVTSDGRWFGPMRAGRHHATIATAEDIAREAARERSAKPSAWVTAYPRGRYVDEAHINVTTTIGDLAGSHGRAYAALKKAGIAPARSSAGSIRLTVEEGLSLPQARKFVTSVLKDAGIKVYE